MINIVYMTTSAVYAVGGMIWFLLFYFLKEQSFKKAFLKSIVWPYFAIFKAKYWTKKNSYLIESAEFVQHLDEIKNDPNYKTDK